MGSWPSPLNRGLLILLVVIFLFGDDLALLWWLDRIFPGWRSRWKDFLPLLIILNGAFIAIAVAVVKALTKKPVTGQEGLLGEEGLAISRIAPEGRAFLHGEIWNVASDEEIEAGEKIVVVEVRGLSLKVQKVSARRAGNKLRQGTDKL